MRSQYGELYNHDAEADLYDQDVRDEGNPIRTGYAAALRWVGEQVSRLSGDSTRVLDLGCGTGNTILALPRTCTVTGVDLSQRMIEQATAKLSGGDRTVNFVLDDILSYVARVEAGRFDTVVSTYTIHHLTGREKHALFAMLADLLDSGGLFVAADLMFENDEAERTLRNELAAEYPAVVRDFDEEFFWYLDDATRQLRSLGFRVDVRRFSALSWGVAAHR